MANVVNKASIIPDIWKNFYDRIKAQVTTTTITGSVVVTVQNYISSFPDNMLDTKSNYPIIVVNDPKVPTGPLTVGKTRIDGTIELEIYTNQAESASKFISLMINAIETYKGDLAGVLIKNIEIVDTNQDSAIRGDIKLHNRSVTFSFTHTYAKTGGF
jgi:hypothetical protein